MVLDVDKDETKFYSNDFLTNDSIRIETGEYEFSYPKFKSSLKRKTGTGENTSYITLSPLYYSLKTNDIQHWKISDETKNIGNFKAQKATANFGGRHWEAWFSTELPFSEGPYKFRGLPGLILEMEDSTGTHAYKFVGSKKFDDIEKVEKKEEELEAASHKHLAQLEAISGLTSQEAKDQLIDAMKNAMAWTACFTSPTWPGSASSIRRKSSTLATRSTSRSSSTTASATAFPWV